MKHLAKSSETRGEAARGPLWLATAAALWLALAPAQAIGAPPLSVCAEPDNLPFTQRQGPPKGFYLDLADALGKELGRPVRYVWMDGWGLGGVRVAFAQRQCDLYFGLPAKDGLSAPYLKLTPPFAHESYALVVTKGAVVRSFAHLTGRRAAVQYGTPPQMLLAVNNIDMLTCDTVAEAMTALSQREVNAAFLWGPAAGYYNKTVLHGAYQILPTSGWGLDWPVAIGVRQDEGELLSAVDGKLGGLHLLVEQLERQYGFPTGAPVVLAHRESAPPSTVSLKPALGTGDGLRVAGFAAHGAALALAATDAVAGVDSDASETGSLYINKLESRAGSSTSVSSRPLSGTGIRPPDAHGRQAARAWLAAQAAAGGANGKTASMSPATSEGRDLFNSRCGHCHGDDAITGNTERSVPDLLRKVPPDQMQSFFIAVVTNGEPDQGMPPWRGALSEEQMKKIFAFIRWVQDHPPKD